jgi:biopolymer transport protein TolR
MGFSTGPNQRTAMSEINVTPLVDVMLVLLIIFMVTAPMMQEGVTVDLPEAKGAPIQKEQKKEEIIIAISDKGKIFVNETEIAEDELVQRIVDTTTKSPDKEVYLRADKSVPYGIVVRVMGALKAAGVANLGMITTPAENAGQTK